MNLVTSSFGVMASVLLFNIAIAQKLKPGFDKAEYIELLRMNAKIGDAARFKQVPKPEHFNLNYRSPVMGLSNMWELWSSQDSIAAISIRGTTGEQVSWLANFYAAMVPATGRLTLSNTDTFNYKLADNPNAAVHAGWLIAMGFLAKDILPRLDSCYKAGIRDFFIVGHSQGGGIAYLLTAYLYALQKANILPDDLRFKTYCSAGPKPGNLYFAYDYEKYTAGGWAFNVVNDVDWVPEVPISIQTLHDFNPVNPFNNARAKIKKMKFPKNIALGIVFNRLDKSSRKAQRNYQKYLGKKLSPSVGKNLPGFQAPTFFASSNYVRTGNTIVLSGKEDYFRIYPANSSKPFEHHSPYAYLYLADKL